ncbi:MAG TPA: Gfo/Idh/MocA family oxidoreductase [Leifsonia sp.]
MSTPLKVAIVGTENSHVDKIVDYLNVHRSSDAARIVALVGADSERNRSLAARGGIPTIVPTSGELTGAVDALIVTNRDGALHRSHAEPYLRAGVPVWVDKPLATSIEDARALVDAARAGGVPLTSYSPVRWVADTERIVEQLPELGAIQTVTVTGPADPASEYSGIFFYGIHCADVAQRLAPGEIGPVTVERSAQTVVARYRAGDILVTLQFVEPDESRQVPFHATVVGRHGVVGSELRLGDGYVAPGLETFLRMMETGRPPLEYGDILKPISVLEQIRKEL